MTSRSHEPCDHSTSLSEEERRNLMTRLRRIEGQVRGLQKMIETDRYCPDILMQMSSVTRSIRSAGLVLLKSHLRSCVGDAVTSGDQDRIEQVYEELIDIFRKYPT